MSSFFKELKRRHIYRVGVFYAATVWLLVQIADVIFEYFDLPEKAMQILILVSAIGFPIALIISWLLNIAPNNGEEGGPSQAQSDSETMPQATPSPIDDTRRLVVLPFDCYSEQPLDQIACDGFTEDLTALLSRVPGFFVIARNSANLYKGNLKDLREVGQELGVRYLLEGSIRRMGDSSRVTVQLIEAETGNHLWAEKFDTPVDNLTGIQDAVVNAIAVQLGCELARAEFELARRKNPGDMDAWTLYQSAKGELMFQGWSETSIKNAAQKLRQASERDPEYAAPYAYLSLLLALGYWLRLVDKLEDAHDESLTAANKALELDPNSAEVLGFVGCAFSDLGYKQRGIPLLERAIEMNPANAQARAALGAALIVSGDLEPGTEHLKQAVELSPLDPGLAMWASILSLGSALCDELDNAERWSAEAYKADPLFFPGLMLRAWILGNLGKKQEAQAALDEAKRLNPKLDAEYVRGVMGTPVLDQMLEADIVI